MENENWLITCKTDGRSMESIKSSIMEKWIKSTNKPKLILIDRWELGDELIETLRKIGLPAEAVRFRKI